MHSLTFLPC